jgi:CBS domain-containing protein
MRRQEMTQTVREVMTANPVTLQPGATVADAARTMRDSNIGDVIVVHGGQVFGILTDRDIVVRAIAEGRDVNQTRAGEISSHSPAVVRPDTSVDEVVDIMRSKSIRRLPVIDTGGEVVGVVSIGDLAKERDPTSALADISKSPPNR